MARKTRLHYPGACYHIILRGNAGQDIFFAEQDRSRFLFLLQEGVERYKHRIHGYCLMTNHVHLLMQVGEIPLSRILQNVCFRYTGYINRRLNRTGHLFQGRYKAILIDIDSYLLELIRYIHNNPVRAKMVKAPEDHPWSSHGAYLGNHRVPWLTTDWVLAQFSNKRKAAICSFKYFVGKGLEEGERKEYRNGSIEGQILGDDHFAEKALGKASRQLRRRTTLDQVIAAVCEQYGIDRQDFFSGSRQKRISEPRAVAALLVRDLDHLSLTALGRELQRDLSGLSQAAGRLERKLKQDRQLSEIVDSLREVLV